MALKQGPRMTGVGDIDCTVSQINPAVKCGDEARQGRTIEQRAKAFVEVIEDLVSEWPNIGF